ncbi:hypothetical protein HMPREF1143_1200 [Peptoanaerobacter stomatis]|uniref:Uncharacterized protein n=1 Tax=Peptoanaerobacter stomatis TaxID=796937 RepID=J4WHU2_9FIRM|nr:hypothetical protein HMPREF1143_1200 [Peptoanaerobacter stomatis]
MIAKTIKTKHYLYKPYYKIIIFILLEISLKNAINKIY